MTILELKELLELKRVAMPKRRVTKKDRISIGGFNYNYLVLTKLTNLLVKVANCTCSQKEDGVLLIMDELSFTYRIYPIKKEEK